MDSSFYSGAYASPIRRSPLDPAMPVDQGYGGYSGSGTYVLSPENSIHTSMNTAQQPSQFQGFLNAIQQPQQQGQKRKGILGGLQAAGVGGGATDAAAGGGLLSLAKFLL